MTAVSCPTAATISPDLTPADALRRVARLLQDSGVETAWTDARHLVLNALGLSSRALASNPGTRLGPEGAEAVARAVERRLAGEPVARILGTWEFWGLPFALSPATLVPRPDTETLIERALALALDRTRSIRILDLGTGSGCILVALLHERPEACGVGIDRSLEALETARGNARANGVGDRAVFVQADWCAPLAGPFDLVVSNPPYIAGPAIAGLDAEVRAHDPIGALYGGADGLDAFRALFAGFSAQPSLLAANSSILLEIGHDQAEAVVDLAARSGFVRSRLDRDLAGRPRVVTLQPPFPARSVRAT